MNKCTEELLLRFRAGYGLFWIQTAETLRAQEDIYEAIKDFKAYQIEVKRWDSSDEPDPFVPLNWLNEKKDSAVTICLNFNWYLKDLDQVQKDVVQTLQRMSSELESSKKALVVITPYSLGEACPIELQPLFTSIDFSLPETEEIENLLEHTVEVIGGMYNTEKKFKPPTKEEATAIVSAAKGMAAKEMENAFYLSTVKKGKISPQIVQDMKAEVLKAEAGLEYSQFAETFENLKGYSVLKEFCSGTINSPLSKGILLIGPPGTGKSHFAKCLGNETGLPMLSFEMGSVFGSLVGESESKMRRIISIITAMRPCIVFVDEIEKGLAGAGSSQTSDGGTTQRTMAQWLKFMSDRPDGIYIVATCNQIESMPPEYLRAERWDTAPFFVDLPNEEEIRAIFEYYLKYYDIPQSSKKTIPTLNTLEGWSGAELKALCRISKMMNITPLAAKEYVVPISQTMDVEIARLRKWADGRAIMASSDKIKTVKSKVRAVKL